MFMRNKEIAIITTVANFNLYEKTAGLFPKNIPLYVIDGRNGMHGLHSIFYMFKMLKNRGIKWLIMADEDVIFLDSQKVFDLIDYMEEQNFAVCGVRDGGVIPHRAHNPFVINTFFSILKFSEIEKIFNKNEIKNLLKISPYKYRDNITHLKNPCNPISLYEPYYGFYFWLRKKGLRFLFLDAEMPFKDDEITNAVFDHKGELLLYHTWYARSYGENKKHTARINKILANLPTESESFVKPVIFKNIHFGWQEILRKILRKIKMKLRG